MRIAHVSTYPPIECGIGAYTYFLNKALQKLHNETFVVSQIGAQGKNVLPVFGRQSSSIARDLFNVCDKITPDIIHIQHEYGLYGPHHGIQIVDFILRCRLVGVPVVTTLHTVYPELRDFEKILLRSIIFESNALIVHEDFQKDTLVRHFGQAEKIHVIPHGVREVEPKTDAKKKLGIESNKVILLCGYFRPTKGFHKIVEWFPEMARRLDDALLVIAGKSRGLEYHDYQREFFEAINQSPANDRIMVLRGQFPQHTFDTIISASDVVALPYELGAQSGIMTQCFAFGKPVVASDLPAFQKNLERCEAGFCCRGKEEYIDRICQILMEDDLVKRFQRNMRQYIREKAGWSQIAQDHIKLYQSVVTVPYGRAKHVFWEE